MSSTKQHPLRVIGLLPRRAQALLVANAVNSFGAGLVMPFLLVYFRDIRGLDIRVAPAAIAVFGLCSCCSGLVWGHLLDKLSYRLVMPTVMISRSDNATAPFGRAAVHRQLDLQRGDPLPRGDEFRLIGRTHPGKLAGVDPFLAAPVVDGVIADPQIGRDGRDRAAGSDEIKHSPAELRRIRLRHR
jgi:hypothetical protein